jgi:hypothetical protein
MLASVERHDHRDPDALREVRRLRTIRYGSDSFTNVGGLMSLAWLVS